MSEKELHRLGVIKDVCFKRITQVAAASLLGLTRRHIQRLVNQLRTEGESGLISKRRGKPSNRRYSNEFKEEVLTLIKERYSDFKPTFACEKLSDLHGITLSSETLRQWMIADGIWTPRNRKRKKIYQPRYRRDCIGELIQIDGSEHDWFEGRAEKCCLLVFIDDATSKIMHLHFCESENTFDYMNATRDYLSSHGKPIAFYSDQHTVFKIANPSRQSSQQMTQYARALYELNIELICANSSQAKGRVERANLTLQDRLIKEMRLAGINSIEEANAWSQNYIQAHNGRFACHAHHSTDVHRPLQEASNELDNIFARQVTRSLTKSLTLQYDKVIYILEPTDHAISLIGKRVMLYDYPDGSISIQHCGEEFEYKIFDKLKHVQQGEVVNNKRLGAVLAAVKQSQDGRADEPLRNRNMRMASRKAPRRSMNPVYLSDVVFEPSSSRD